MTSFNNTPTNGVTEGSNAIALPPPVKEKLKESRLKADPTIWDKAMGFAQMLTYCRPHQSKTESKFIKEYIMPVGIKFDKKGNMYKTIPNKDGSAPVAMYSCHVDTVHAKKGFQKIEYWTDQRSGDTYLGVQQPKTNGSSCLGGDDTCGVWYILEMIDTNVPGLYIFHRGEERGGIGSRWIAQNNKEALKDIKFAIAFDRRETESIITYQRSTRCCSDEFAKSLADQLGMGHKCDETGAFTDTASYVDLVAECTNISAGYYDAHMASEKVNLDYMFKLRDALCKLDVTKLVESRKPGENTRKWGSYVSNNHFYDEWEGWDGAGWQSRNSRPEGGQTWSELRDLNTGDSYKWMNNYDYDARSGYWLKKKPKDLGVTKTKPNYYDLTTCSHREALGLIRNNPEIILDLLETQGYGPVQIQDYIRDVFGKFPYC